MNSSARCFSPEIRDQENESTMSHHRHEPKTAGDAIEKLKVLMPHWIAHNDHHIQERERWQKVVEDWGLVDVAREMKASIELAREENRRLMAANGISTIP